MEKSEPMVGGRALSACRVRRKTDSRHLALLVLLVAAATVRAFVNLPSNGSRVDNDAASGIDPAKDAGASTRSAAR